MTENRSNVIQLPQFAPAAKARWQQIPAAAQKEIMDNVWCGHCRTGTTIRIQEGKMSGTSLVLIGICKKCSNPVARVIEPEVNI
jgi:ATP diphosphatase